MKFFVRNPVQNLRLSGPWARCKKSATVQRYTIFIFILFTFELSVIITPFIIKIRLYIFLYGNEIMIIFKSLGRTYAPTRFLLHMYRIVCDWMYRVYRPTPSAPSTKASDCLTRLSYLSIFRSMHFFFRHDYYYIVRRTSEQFWYWSVSAFYLDVRVSLCLRLSVVHAEGKSLYAWLYTSVW